MRDVDANDSGTLARKFTAVPAGSASQVKKKAVFYSNTMPDEVFDNTFRLKRLELSIVLL
jgi:hypothetical protein